MKKLFKLFLFIALFVGVLYLLVVVIWRDKSYLGMISIDKIKNTITQREEDASKYLTNIQLPDGFKIHYYAKNVPNARSLALSDSGILYVGSRAEGKIYAVVDDDGDKVADSVVTIMSDLNSPNGVVWYEGDLYVAEIDKIIKFVDIDHTYDKNLTYRVLYSNLPKEELHGWKYLAIGPDEKLYFPIGANCNICETDPDVYATLNRISLNGEDHEIVARGIRNTVGFTWHPETGDLYFTENGRDWMGDDLPPDEFNKVSVLGENFGYPYCHGQDIVDPEFGEGRNCDDYVKPIVDLAPHTAALGVKFYTGDMFPSEYKNKAFIAEHGSWNRSEKMGYRVTVVNPDTASYDVFASGWLDENNNNWGRPVDIAQMNDGSILVSDDASGSIYRILYED